MKWRDLALFKRATTPADKAQANFFMYAINLPIMLVGLAFFILSYMDKDIKELFGIDFWAKLTVVFFGLLTAYYVFIMIEMWQRYRSLKRQGATI